LDRAHSNSKGLENKSCTLIADIHDHIYAFVNSDIFILTSIAVIFGMLFIHFFMNIIVGPGTALEILLTLGTAAFVAVIGAWVYGELVWSWEYHTKETARMFYTLFSIGIVAATFSFFINTVMEITIQLITESEFVVDVLVGIFLGPFMEEFIKGIGLVIMLKSKYFEDIPSGFAFGFVIGSGFEFLENTSYLSQYSPMDSGILMWILLMGLRIVLLGAIHGIFTGVNGAILGATKNKTLHKTAYMIIGLGIAVVLHSLFNAILTIVTYA